MTPKPEKLDEDEVTSAKKRRFVYTREKKLNEWKKFYIELTDSDRVLDLIWAIRAQQGLECPFSLYLGRESSCESITKDPSRTLGSLHLTEDDVIVFRFGYYKRPRESDEAAEEVSGKKRRK